MTRRSLILLIVAALALSVLVSAPTVSQVRSADELVPPQVVDTTPTRGEELPVAGDLTFYFDQPMDQASVQAAFHTTPNVQGTLTWLNDSTVVFKPAQPLARASEFEFTIGQSAKSTTGQQLRDNYTLRMNTPGALVVSQVLPAADAKDIEATPTITVIFNRPVIPLTPIGDQSNLPNPITIAPDAAGKGEWLSTSIYTFKPTGLSGGTTYKVTVKKGLTDISGSALDKDFTFSFTTVSPRVIEFDPAPNATLILREKQISVTFSQPMDHAATEAAFTLVGGDNKPIPGDFAWGDTSQSFIFTPKSLLDYGTIYTATVDSQKARSATGSSLGGPNAVTTFSTIGTPDIASTSPQNKGLNVDPFGGLHISFTAPMQIKDLKSHITVDPKPALDYDVTQTDDLGQEVSVGFSTEPSTAYTITIDTNGLVDKYGTPIALNPNSGAYKIVAPGKAQISYTTNAYPPEASLKTGADVGLYSAYRSSTRVYATHRNITQIDLSLWSIPLPDFLQIASSNGQSGYNATNSIRRWSITVDNPHNVLRYDLLGITDQGPNQGAAPAAAISCPGAPPTRLKVGVQAVVLSDDPRPLRVRNNAGLNAQQIAQLQPGTQMTINGGPVCQDGYVWWKFTTVDNSITGWAAEGDQTHYFIGPVSQAQAGQVSANDPNAKALKPGFYLLQMSSPQLPADNGPLKHFMLVGTANVTLKMAQDRLMAWVTDLQSGQPVPGVAVQFYQQVDSGVQPLGTPIKTDPTGLAIYDLPKRLVSVYNGIFAVVNDGKNLGIGSSTFDNGLDPFSFNLQGDGGTADTTVYMYSDRSLYRPGQPVYFKGVVRSRNDMKYTRSKLKVMTVAVYDDQNQVLYQKDLPLTPFGTFSDSFQLTNDASLGSYRIVARPNYDPKLLVDNGYYNGLEFERDILIAQYRVPEFQVKVTADQPQVVQGDKINVTVDSTFFFGGAVNNAHVDWNAHTQDYYFNYTASNAVGSYSFFDFNEDEGFSIYDQSNGQQNVIAQGTGRTDGQGKFVIQLPADLGKATLSQTFTIEADITDESGQVISGSVDVTVHQGEFYIGAVPEDYVGTAQKAVNIDLIAVDLNSQPKPNTDLSVRTVERKWSSVQTVEPDTGRTVWNDKVDEIPVGDTVVRTDDKGQATYSFIPSHGGIYKIYATSRDSRGNQITTSTFVYVAGPDYVPWRQQNSNRIDLKIDRTSFKVGDTASILIASPYQGTATALVTVERGSILKSEVIQLPTNSTVYQLPITPDMAPNAFVSVIIMKGVDDKNPVASFKMGLVQFDVQTDRLKLNIDVTSDKPQAGPGDNVTYKLHVTDYTGKPVQAELGVGLSDLAVLSLLPDTSAPILQHFYGQTALSVRTASSLVNSVDQRTQEILSTIKGGGGGGGESGIFQVRQRFEDTPLWKPSIITDPNGDANVSLTLPDNLTTWRLDVRAVTMPTGDTNSTLVGQTTTDLISTKPLLIRPITPRFYIVGDTSTLAAIINNNTGADQTVTAKIDLKGATLSGNASQNVQIPSGQRVRVEWPITVLDTDSVSVTFFANTADNKYTDAAKSAVGQGNDKILPVGRYLVPETVGTGGVIGKDGGTLTEGIVLPRGYTVTQGSLNVKFDRSLAASAVDALNALQNWPIQSTEWTVSTFLPNLATAGALKKLNVDNPSLRDQLNSEINYAIQRLYAEQHADGGWGWFVTDKSDVLMTAYALVGLGNAQKQGYNIDSQVVSDAIKFMRSNLPQIGDQAATWQLNRQAFELYALANAGAGDLGRTTRLFSIREKMSIFARAYLALTFFILQPNNKANTDALISDLQNRAIASATGQHWEEDYEDFYNWNTDTRSTAIVLEALVQIQPTNALIPNVVRWLMVARKADTWETTQETAWAVLALSDWMQYTGELKPNYSFDARLNGNSVGNAENASPDNAQQSTQLTIDVSKLLAGQVNKLTVNRTAGDGLLYYTAYLNAYLPVDQVQPVSRGITITRQYSLANDVDNKPITQAAVGDILKVTLNIVAPQDMYYLTITDPIPAGAEGIDPNLATTGTIGQAPQLNSNDPLSQGWGWWWFNKTELRDDRTMLYATYLPRGSYQFTYTVRAGLAGAYSVLPSFGQETYFPEVYGRSSGFKLTLTPAQGNNDPTNQNAGG